jgi:acetylornithine/succinyldiaminopimelate/putrescine aminotransferase
MARSQLRHRAHFRELFEQQLSQHVYFARFGESNIDEILESHDIGAIIVEPIQGRGGIVMPPPDFLRALRERCDGETRLLIFDEIYTGCGRTGRWLACEHWDVVPDVVVIGKGLSGALPISACVGKRDVMNAWPLSNGEAIHTSTFLGNPVACAAALAQLAEVERLLPRVRELAELIERWAADSGHELRGLGLIQGLVLTDALEVSGKCLERGVLVLAEGPESNVLAITPPAVITNEQLSYALSQIDAILSRLF